MGRKATYVCKEDDQGKWLGPIDNSYGMDLIE